MKVQEKVFINYKGEKYINGKKSATVLPKPETHTFEEAVKYIDKTFNKYGYSYDILELDKCGGEENFVKYSKMSQNPRK